MIIHSSKTCKNSPKNQFVEDYTTALFQRDREFLRLSSDEDYTLEILGKNKQLDKLFEKGAELWFFFSISHGKFGSCTGELLSTEERYSFAAQYEFTNTTRKRVQKVQLFLIKKES
ncbi:hypothetical protein [Enterococcus olivae]